MTRGQAGGHGARRLHADLLLLVAAAAWGTAFYFQKSAMDHIGPMTFFGLRALISAVALLPLALRERRSAAPDDGAVPRIAAWAALAFLAAGFLQQAGLVSATVINASFLTALYVVLTPLLYWLVYRTAPHPPVWAGVALAFAGSWLLGGGTVGGFSRGDWLITGSTLAWAVHILVTQAAARHGRPFAFTCFQFALVAALALPLAAITEGIDWTGALAAWQSLLFVGLLSGGLGFGIMAVALRHTPVAEATIIMSLETIFAALAGYVLLGERLEPLGWLGGTLIFSAVLVVQLGRLRWAPHPAA